jgi:hypothetical protein
LAKQGASAAGPRFSYHAELLLLLLLLLGGEAGQAQS